MYKFNYEELEKAVESSGLKKTFIAEKMSMTPQAFSGIISGNTKIEVSRYMTLCDVLHVPVGSFIDTVAS